MNTLMDDINEATAYLDNLPLDHKPKLDHLDCYRQFSINEAG